MWRHNIYSGDVLKVSDIGEVKLINKLFSIMGGPGGITGFDDVVAVKTDRVAVVVKTDSFVESADRLPGMPPEAIGHKTVVMNVSDFAAKGVKPMGMLVSLAVPPDTDVGFLEIIYKGMVKAAASYGFRVMGGDTSTSRELILAGFLFGVQKPDLIVQRRGAKTGDIVATTGFFGDTACAYMILLKHMSPGDQVLERRLVNHAYFPEARLKEGLALASHRLASAAIDCSDGLAVTLHQLAEASCVGILIDNVPVSPDAKKYAEYYGLDPVELALYRGGEEFELVVTIPEEKWYEACKVVESVGGRLLRLGRVVSRIGVFINMDGEEKPVKLKGWEHFKGWV